VGVGLVAAVDLLLQFAALTLEVGLLFASGSRPFIHLRELDIVRVGMSGGSNAALWSQHATPHLGRKS
jgi:hypothetical protein